MYRLKKQFRFEAAHYLPNHDGKCFQLHGHSWRGAIQVAGRDLHQTGPKVGMLCDYGDLSALLQPIVAFLDHKCLNEIEGFRPPTSEVVARWIYEKLAAFVLELGDCFLESVTIEETCTAACEYSPEDSASLAFWKEHLK